VGLETLVLTISIMAKSYTGLEAAIRELFHYVKFAWE
jgi:hypothetical protein